MYKLRAHVHVDNNYLEHYLNDMPNECAFCAN